jgi:hypothetical protein
LDSYQKIDTILQKRQKIMVYIGLIIIIFLVQYTWRYLQLEVYLDITKELQNIKSISNDDLLQQQKLTALSKKLLISSLINFSILMLWISPFIVLYFTFGKGYISLLMSSTTFWLISLFLSITLYYINKKK